jgi:hypothetical protein
MAENVISTSLNIGIKALLVLSTAIAVGLPRAYASEPEPIRVAAGAQFDVELELGFLNGLPMVVVQALGSETNRCCRKASVSTDSVESRGWDWPRSAHIQGPGVRKDADPPEI